MIDRRGRGRCGLHGILNTGATLGLVGFHSRVILADIICAKARDSLILLQLVVSLLRDDVLVRTLQVGFNASRRLSCHFKTALKDGLREVVHWHGCQDKSEVFVNFLVLHKLRHKYLKLRHP